MEGGNGNRRGRVDNSCTERPPVWHQTPVPSPHQGRYICFRAGHDATKTTNLYSIPIDGCEGGGGGEAVGLKPFNRSTLSKAATFAGVGTSLFCIGGMEAPNGTTYKNPTSNLYQFDSTDPEGGWHVLKMLSCRVLPISIAMDGKLYIFNGCADVDASRPWAEVFDPRWDSSLSFPLQPVGHLRRFSEFVYAALHSSKRILVASITCNAAYVYHVVDGHWKELDHNIDFTGHVVRNQAAVVRNTTLCWYRDTVHQLEAYDLDLKRWFNCPVKGLKEVGVLPPCDMPTYFSLFPMDDNHLCFLWMDHSGYSCTRYRYSLLHCTKIQVSIKVGAQGEHGLDAFVVSSTSYVLDEGVWLLSNDACVLYGEKDVSCTEAVDVTGANWEPVGGCGMGNSFNRGERVGEWGGHDHAGRTSGLGGNGGGSRNACFKCGVTGHMARDCYPVGGGGGGRYLSGSGSCGGRRGPGHVEKRISPKNAINAAS